MAAKNVVRVSVWLLLISSFTYTCAQKEAAGKNLENHVLDKEDRSCDNSISLKEYYTPEFADKLIEDVILAVKDAEKSLTDSSKYPAHYSPEEGEQFDFIVVGAGSAGAVVASRLTENPDWRVLLIEAGGDPTKTSEIPALMGTLQRTGLDWQYKTQPEENSCLGMVNRTCLCPRGKALGGSSTINFMFYVRGNAKDFDGWAEAGNPEWSYKHILPYFTKSEDLRAYDALSTPDYDKYHGRGGRLKVESLFNTGNEEITGAFGKGLEELGYPFNLDYNGKNQSGFSPFQATLEDSRRCSTAKAFLSPSKRRSNLKVSKHSLVTKLLIDERTSTAYGVEFVNEKGKTVRVRAAKEVVLSAGAINSPQLLMLSGVGPRQHLEDLDIAVIRDLPVGKNLQDHPFIIGVLMTGNYSVPSESSVNSMYDFLLKRPSKMSSTGLLPYVGFINTVEGTDYPDMELMQIHFNKDSSDLNLLLSVFGYSDDVKEKFLDINRHSFTVLLAASMLRPYSRGRILLESSDPKIQPMIVNGYLSDKRDMDTFLRTYEFLSRLANTEAIKDAGIRLHEIGLSACSDYPLFSTDHRKCTIKHLITTTYHYSGSCKMGPTTDITAVVDPTLMVHGLQGLRVADASIMPTVVSGHTNAAAIMIGEKASDLIKQKWIS